MNIEYHRWWSPSLNQDMELKVYGHAGKPVVVFPCQAGRFYEYEDYGMVAAVQEFIECGQIQLYTVDSIDAQTWANQWAHPADRARRHNEYDRYVVSEVAPFIQERRPNAGKLLATGCSLGAYHAGNFFFRHPDLFDACLCISGLFSLNYYLGEYMDENVYYNTPLAYLPRLNDPWYIDQYRQSRIIVCTGQGAWEDLMYADAMRLKEILDEKDIPAWVDIWGQDVNHDWPWWRQMVPYFLRKMELPQGA